MEGSEALISRVTFKDELRWQPFEGYRFEASCKSSQIRSRLVRFASVLKYMQYYKSINALYI